MKDFATPSWLQSNDGVTNGKWYTSKNVNTFGVYKQYIAAV